jgi:predicted phosphodiesterase
MADNLHELVAAVKNMAQSLGHPPTRAEFLDAGGWPISAFQRIPGGFTQVLKMAGLEDYNARRTASSDKKRVDGSIFLKDIEQHVSEYTPPTPVPTIPLETMAVASDFHRPFVCERVQRLFLEYVGDEKPEWVIENGDCFDMYSHSRFPRSHNLFTPREEVALSRKQQEDFWRAVAQRAPKAKRVLMMGNHDVRPMKRVLESYPEAEDWMQREMERLFTYDGVRTVYDHREEVLVGGVAIFHGYRTGLGAHRDFTLMNCITGHTHRGGVVFRTISGARVLWELNCGMVGDPLGKGLTYTPMKINGWTPGFGAVDNRGPRFIPG